ncbi:MAG: hypothetical protein ACOYXT_07240 [Bacteroidota bacterium]
MKYIKAIFLLYTLFSFLTFEVMAQENADKATPIKNIERIVGQWSTQKVYKGTKEITHTDTVGMSRTFEFDREGRYISREGDYKIDSGAYRLNEVQSVLYLESVSGEKPTEWRISFAEGKMVLQPRDIAPEEEKFRYVFVRKSFVPRGRR